MWSLLKRFVWEEDGQGFVEYAMIWGLYVSSLLPSSRAVAKKLPAAIEACIRALSAAQRGIFDP